MSVRNHYDERHSLPDLKYEDDPDTLKHKQRVRRMLEDRLERKRLREEMEDELDGEFDWSDLDH